MEQLFQCYGPMYSLSLKYGYAYANFCTKHCAETAYKYIHNTTHWGSNITIVRQYDVPGHVTIPQPPSQFTVKISNLPAGTTEEDLKHLCKGYGEIHSIKVNKGYCYINFTDPNNATHAANFLNGLTFRDSTLKAKCHDFNSTEMLPQSQTKIHPKSTCTSELCNPISGMVPNQITKPPITQYTIKISNLPLSTTQDELKCLCDEYGEIQSIKVNMGYSYVNYFKCESAKKAIECLDNEKFHGSVLKVTARFDQTQPHYDLQTSAEKPSVTLSQISRTIKVTINDLSNSISANDLKALFSKYGKIVQNIVIKAGSPNFAYINYETSDQACEALKLNGIKINNALLTVKIANKEVMISKELVCNDSLINKLFSVSYLEEFKAKFSLEKSSLVITPLKEGGIKVIGEPSMVDLCESYFELKVKDIKSSITSISHKFQCYCIPSFQNVQTFQDIEKACSVEFSISSTYNNAESLLSFSNFIQKMASPLLLECVDDYLVNSSHSVQWYYEDDKGTYIEMSNSDSMAIETTRQQSKVARYTINNWTYTYDFHAMTQRNTSTGKVKKIRCDNELCQNEITIHCRGMQSSVEQALDMLTSEIQKVISSTSIQLTSGQSPQAILTEAKRFCVSADINTVSNTLAIKGCQAYLQLVRSHLVDFKGKLSLQNTFSTSGPYWEPQIDDIELKNVQLGSQEWNKVEKEMKMSMPFVTIVKLERIQNIISMHSVKNE